MVASLENIIGRVAVTNAVRTCAIGDCVSNPAMQFAQQPTPTADNVLSAMLAAKAAAGSVAAPAVTATASNVAVASAPLATGALPQAGKLIS